MPVDATLDTLLLEKEEHGPVCLLIVGGTTAGHVHELEGRGPWVLGRSRRADVRIDDASISRLHARISLDPTPSVSDLESANGTRVRGVRLEPNTRAEVRAGEPIEVGTVLVMIHRRGQLPSTDVAAPPTVEDVIGDSVARSESMRRVFGVVSRVARSQLSVLLLGETGSGKEVIAQALHQASGRSGPFVALNCGAVPETLFESKVFGHRRGAFTGADEDRAGLFESAEGGTVFLDEIAELAPVLQAKLLRVIETRQVVRVGEHEVRAIDVRLVSATHRDLPTEALSGGSGFRADLYFRLNGVTIRVPALRDRLDDIEALADVFSAGTTIDAGAKAALVAHAWPGNVRELRNVIQRALVMSGGDTIRAEHLDLGGDSAGASVDAADLKNEMKRLERERILEALETCEGNQTRAAKLLGMPRRTFVSRLDEYDIPRPRKRR